MEGQPEGDADESPASPESYSTEGIKLPEGMKLDEVTAGELGKVCKEHGLTQKAFAGILEKMTPVLAQRQQQQLQAAKVDFIKRAKADPEMGGANWAATKQAAGKALGQFADSETIALLKATGLNCHPGVIRMFKKISDAVSDDAIVRGDRGGGSRKSLAGYYNNSQMND
ncbi:hypothetical protein [Sutterella sp.]|uniref:hypothetical protein n=1 Tax=Sutterella sp. TaxID=1981025 RepID=UPI0026E0037D|nr:hypothetical protein [Sutterella sp.]MDO5531060.1 hypothetical protein [Sutterella sp.]